MNTGAIAMPAIQESDLQSRLDGRARRAAKKIGLVARRSRWRAGSVDNWGGFVLIDPYTNFIVAGSRFDMSAEEVIRYCASPA
jgi:hypothetical protein